MQNAIQPLYARKRHTCRSKFRNIKFSKIRPHRLCNIIIPWSIKYMWSNAAHSLLILTSPNCSLICGHFPVWCGGLCTSPGGVRAAPDGFGQLLVGPLRYVIVRNFPTSHISIQRPAASNMFANIGTCCMDPIAQVTRLYLVYTGRRPIGRNSACRC